MSLRDKYSVGQLVRFSDGTEVGYGFVIGFTDIYAVGPHLDMEIYSLAGLRAGSRVHSTYQDPETWNVSNIFRVPASRTRLAGAEEVYLLAKELEAFFSDFALDLAELQHAPVYIF